MQPVGKNKRMEDSNCHLYSDFRIKLSFVFRIIVYFKINLALLKYYSTLEIKLPKIKMCMATKRYWCVHFFVPRVLGQENRAQGMFHVNSTYKNKWPCKIY